LGTDRALRALRLLAVALVIGGSLGGCAVGAPRSSGPSGAPTIVYPPEVLGESPSADGSAALAPELFDLKQLDGSTWCSPTRGDCIELRLPDVIGFGGRSTGTWRPTAVGPDGCYRTHGGDFDLWYCPAGVVVDVESRRTSIDNEANDSDRLIVKFKGDVGMVFLRSG